MNDPVLTPAPVELEPNLGGPAPRYSAFGQDSDINYPSLLM